MTVEIKFIIKTAIRLRDALKQLLAEVESPTPYFIAEAVVESIAEVVNMVAITRDDLPDDVEVD